MRLALYTLIILGAALLAFDLAKEAKNIEAPAKLAPTKPVRPTQDDRSENAAKQLAELTEKITASPKDAALYAERANLYIATGDRDKAIADLDQAIALAPKNTEFLSQRGSTHLMFKNQDAALADFSRALEINPEFTKALVYRAIIYYRKNDFQAALDDCLLIRKQDPSFTDVHHTIARCYKELGNRPKAIEHLKLYIKSLKDPTSIQEATSLLKAWETPSHPSSP